MDKSVAQASHRSTTHEERYFHFPFKTPDPTSKFIGVTVFARKEPLMDNLWYASIAYCARGDRFEKRVGRTVARRKYFYNVDHRFIQRHLLGATITVVDVKAFCYDMMRAAQHPPGHRKPYK